MSDLDEVRRQVRLAYIQAVARVRARPSPEAWVLLRAAARELDDRAGDVPGHRHSPSRRRARVHPERSRAPRDGPGTAHV